MPIVPTARSHPPIEADQAIMTQAENIGPRARRLDALPNELLGKIAENLDCGTLASLSLVSRKFVAVAQDIMYRRPVVRANCSDGTLLLIRTLLQRPDLANKVRKLHYSQCSRRLCPSSYGGVDVGNAVEEMCTEYLQRFEESRKNKPPITTEWAQNLQRHISAYMGVLLTSLPNIQEFSGNLHVLTRNHMDTPLEALFSIHGEFSPNDGLIEHIDALSPLFCGIRKVAKLRIPASTISLLNLPFDNLKSLDVDMTYMTEEDGVGLASQWLLGYLGGSRYNVVRTHEHLSTLTIRSHCLEWRVISRRQHGSVYRLIQRLGCPKVTRLAFMLRTGPWNIQGCEFSGRISGFELFFANLGVLCESLESVTVDYEEPPAEWGSLLSKPDPGVYPEFIGEWKPAGDIRRFKKIKTLSVLQRVLMDSTYRTRNTNNRPGNILPYCLESLTIICPNRKILRWMKDLIEDCFLFPHLQHIVLLCRKEWGVPVSPSWLSRAPIFDKFRKAGITMDIIGDSGERGFPEYGMHGHGWQDEDGISKEGGPSFWEGTWADDNWTSMLHEEI
ncbi:uncharacterized protein EI97DRAFT_459326 [Westerdykella ornata]|uniref:F-box domain-containing protein n=1 Tax=Westerdykella ornata TaxID=318751 RepID=A0A6A6JKK8_WESOR|nr:uncharacterized protein EI97DRAFT_459326 [Westerdykella ornata]KAF2275419.1 hypothetical protein EI97DRAFT_459326 [Westerdykella ornata]